MNTHFLYLSICVVIYFSTKQKFFYYMVYSCKNLSSNDFSEINITSQNLF